MRVLTLALFTITLFFSTFSAHALDGIPASFKAGGTNLTLNGAGKRTKFVITVYNAGLYLVNKSSNSQQIIDANEAMALRMKIKSGFASAEKMEAALMTGFVNSTRGNTGPIKPQIDQLINAAFKGKIKKGDIFDMVYTPGNGTLVLKNAKVMTTLKGLPIKKALFGIWLSAKPAQGSLKAELLGKEF